MHESSSFIDPPGTTTRTTSGIASTQMCVTQHGSQSFFVLEILMHLRTLLHSSHLMIGSVRARLMVFGFLLLPAAGFRGSSALLLLPRLSPPTFAFEGVELSIRRTIRFRGVAPLRFSVEEARGFSLAPFLRFARFIASSRGFLCRILSMCKLFWHRGQQKFFAAALAPELKWAWTMQRRQRIFPQSIAMGARSSSGVDAKSSRHTGQAR
eukprot:CAMPEP_0170186098 /NCGR_PEP_ID=MMETSP0040_2-20121228/38290_1 /TAXON_ID=641309 /ORGANISM="Lotharella oceanica, Strain CCMP622" /LENGTH=209 /DNA_ID=CAMNT_0010432723 /DNA_START=330 /DNA_END=956 /DNA_ORIENTATION=-